MAKRGRYVRRSMVANGGMSAHTGVDSMFSRGTPRLRVRFDLNDWRKDMVSRRWEFESELAGSWDSSIKQNRKFKTTSREDDNRYDERDYSSLIEPLPLSYHVMRTYLVGAFRHDD